MSQKNREKRSKINGTRSAARPRLDAADVDRVEFYCRPEMVFINTQNSANSEDEGRRTKMAAADTYGRGNAIIWGQSASAAHCTCENEKQDIRLSQAAPGLPGRVPGILGILGGRRCTAEKDINMCLAPASTECQQMQLLLFAVAFATRSIVNLS